MRHMYKRGGMIAVKNHVAKARRSQGSSSSGAGLVRQDMSVSHQSGDMENLRDRLRSLSVSKKPRGGKLFINL